MSPPDWRAQAPAAALEFGSVSGQWTLAGPGLREASMIRRRPSQELVVLVSYTVGCI